MKDDAKKDGPTMTLETITPLRAEDYLKKNTRNRTTVRARIKQYAKDMMQNEWMVNGETIQFDTNGELLNGQHRLLACIDAKCSFKTYVVRGLPPEVMPTVDTGKARNAGDALHILGGTNTKMVAAATTWILRYKSDNLAAGRGYFSHSKIIKFWEENKDIEKSIIFGRKCQPIIAPAIASGFHFLFSEVADEDEANQFMEDLISGANLSPTDPVHILRETCIKNKSQKIKFQPVEIAAKLVRAWNYRRVGKDVKSLQGTTLVDGKRVFPDIQ